MQFDLVAPPDENAKQDVPALVRAVENEGAAVGAKVSELRDLL
ncbi:MAG: hypothetical protein ABI072_06230 [Edaphobacter sp.]